MAILTILIINLICLAIMAAVLLLAFSKDKKKPRSQVKQSLKKIKEHVIDEFESEE